MPLYGGFAALYDRLMDDVCYPAWARYYLSLFEQAGLHPAALADAASGTGKMAIEFAKYGIRVTGSDLSGEMLAVAGENARQSGVSIVFTRQDMRRLALTRPVDAITACCDGVNYLLSEQAVLEFFSRAFQTLKPGGALAFDISSRYKLEHILADGFFGEDRDDVTYLWQNSYCPQTRLLTMDLTFFLREKDGRYRRMDETHVQRAHDEGELRSLLAKAGFSDIRVYGDRTLDPPKDAEERIHFLAIRR